MSEQPNDSFEAAQVISRRLTPEGVQAQVELDGEFTQIPPISAAVRGEIIRLLNEAQNSGMI